MQQQLGVRVPCPRPWGRSFYKRTLPPQQPFSANVGWWQVCRLQGVFSNTDSFYFLPHTQNKNRERYASALSKYCFFITVGLVTGLQRRGLQWLHHDAGTQHCSLQLHAATRAGSRSATAGTHQYYARITMQWTVFILYPLLLHKKEILYTYFSLVQLIQFDTIIQCSRKRSINTFLSLSIPGL